MDVPLKTFFATLEPRFATHILSRLRDVILTLYRQSECAKPQSRGRWVMIEGGL